MKDMTRELLPFIRENIELAQVIKQGDLIRGEAIEECLRDLRTFFHKSIRKENILFAHIEVKPLVICYLKRERDHYKESSEGRRRYGKHHKMRYEYLKYLIKELN